MSTRFQIPHTSLSLNLSQVIINAHHLIFSHHFNNMEYLSSDNIIFTYILDKRSISNLELIKKIKILK